MKTIFFPYKVALLLSTFYLISCNSILYKKIPTTQIIEVEMEPFVSVKIISKLESNRKCEEESTVVSAYTVVVANSGDTVLVLSPCVDFSIEVGTNRSFYPDKITASHFYMPYKIENEYNNQFKAAIGKLVLFDD